MWNKAALLAAALAFSLPAIADIPSNSKTPLTKPKTEGNRHIQNYSYSFGAANTATVPKGNGGAAGKVSPGSINVKNPCKQPHPPHDCKQPRPPH